MVEGVLAFIAVVMVAVYYIEPRTGIKDPTKKILELLKGDSGRFIVRVRTQQEEAMAAERKRYFCDFVLEDTLTRKTTEVYRDAFHNSYHFTGDLRWMNGNERNMVGKVAAKIRKAQRDAKENADYSYRESLHQELREKAKETYK